MFSKVLVTEDLDSINKAISKSLKELKITDKKCVSYCDDALLQIKKALLEENPFELLISDLSFKEDHNENKLNSGEELIAAVKEIQPNIKVIVYSVEEKPTRIKSLFENLDIDGFVLKGRNSLPELKKAIETVFETEDNYIAPNLNYILQDKTIHQIDNYDIQLLLQLSYGVSQERMEEKFKDLDLKPYSKSSIEKRINKLKDYFKANNTINLIAIAKDLGII